MSSGYESPLNWKYARPGMTGGAPVSSYKCPVSYDNGHPLDPALLAGRAVAGFDGFSYDGGRSLNAPEYLHVSQSYQQLQGHAIPRQHYANPVHHSRPSPPRPRSSSSSSSLSFSTDSSPVYDLKSSLLPPAIIYEEAEGVADAAWFAELQDPSVLQQSVSPPIHHDLYPSLYAPSNSIHLSPLPLYADPSTSAASLIPPFVHSSDLDCSKVLAVAPNIPSRPFHNIPIATKRSRSTLAIAVPSLQASSLTYPSFPTAIERLPSQEEVEEMDRLMVEIRAILGPEMMASLAPPWEDMRSPSKRARRLSQVAPEEQAYFPPTYELEVLHPGHFRSQLQLPKSAPAWQASFDVSSRDSFLDQQHSPLPLYAFDPSYSLPPSSLSLSPSSLPRRSHHPLHEVIRPRTSPEGDTRPPFAAHRRGSSCEPSMPCEQSHVPYPSVLAGVHGPLLPRSPLACSQPYLLATPPRGIRSSTPQSSGQPLSTPTTPKSPRKASPKKTPGTPRGKKAPGGMNAFINYSASDAKKLLSGVAPSGSSKRKREEEVPIGVVPVVVER